MIRVLIADDHPLVRSGLRAVCSGATDIEVVGEAADGYEVIAEALRLEPDVILMDLEMPQLRGIDATRRIVAETRSTAVLVLTMFDDEDSVITAIKAGAVGYLLKGSDGDDILAAIRAAATGQAVFGSALTSRLAAWLSGSPRDHVLVFPDLTDRERDILDQLAAGLTNAEIADNLHLATKTVANNISIILTKLQVTQRGQAIVLAREAGLGRPGSADPRTHR